MKVEFKDGWKIIFIPENQKDKDDLSIFFDYYENANEYTEIEYEGSRGENIINKNEDDPIASKITRLKIRC